MAIMVRCLAARLIQGWDKPNVTSAGRILSNRFNHLNHKGILYYGTASAHLSHHSSHPGQQQRIKGWVRLHQMFRSSG